MSMEQNQAKAPPEVKLVMNFLRNKAGMKTRVGVLGGKRVDYFKGRSAIKALLSPAYSKLKSVPPITTEEQATTLLNSYIPYTFFLRSSRGPHSSGAGSPRVIQINPQQAFIPDEYYVWLMDSNPLKLMLGAVGMVVVVLAAVMFPLWPAKLRVGVWYLSIAVLGLIGLFFAIAVFRLIFYVITLVVAKPGIWIFPNLFADVGFVDSFIPLWGWDIPPPKKSKSKKSKKDKIAAAGHDHAGHDHAGHDHAGHSHGPTEINVPRIVELEDDE